MKNGATFMDGYIQKRKAEGAVDIGSFDQAFAEALNDPDSVVTYLSGGYEDAIRSIVGGISSGTDRGMASAKQAYDDLNDTVGRSGPALNSVLRHPGGSSSRTVARFQELARDAITHQYNHVKVDLPDGTQTTIGQYFQDPGRFSRSFNRKGHASEAYDVYMGGDDPQGSRMLAPFMDPAFRNAGGRGVDENHVQNSDGSLAVYNNMQALKDAFGDGAELFTDRIHSELADVGGYAKAIPAFCTYAQRKSARTGLSGSALAADVANDFRTLYSRVEASASGTSKKAELSPDSRTVIAAAAIEAMNMMESSGQSVDISDPVKSKALIEGMSARAQAKASGYGASFDDADTGKIFGDHVSKAGTYESGQSLLAQWYGTGDVPGFYQMGKSLVTGGAGFVPDQRQLTSSVSRWGSVRMSSGGSSTSPTLDALASRLFDKMAYEEFLPKMKENMSPDQIRSVLSSDIGSYERVTSGLRKMASEFGVADAGAQQFLADLVYGAVVNGQPVNIETLLHETVFPTDGGKPGNDPTYRALRQLYMAAVEAPSQFREERASAKAWLMSKNGYGLTEMDAEALLMKSDLETAALVSAGAKDGSLVDPAKHYSAIRNSGWLYVYVDEQKDKNGNVVVPAHWAKSWNTRLDEFAAGHKDLKHIDPAMRRAALDRMNEDNRLQYALQEEYRTGVNKAYDSTLMRREALRDAAEDRYIGRGISPY